ncbi:MAG TPA: nuclear transport factor 2 family protein [Actinomycetaceae bacterium]|nr:nuclear transport factor 2 family protein [Actinomycetaceae bacterium]
MTPEEIDSRDTYVPPNRRGADQPPSPADRLEIDELFSRYSWAIDTGDVDGFEALFVDDAELEDTVVGRSFTAPGAARAFATYFREREVFPGRQHWVGPAVMTMAGDDTCHIRSFVMASHLYSTGANYLTFLGSYDDVVVRTEQGWKFQRRRFFNWTRDTFKGRRRELALEQT